MLARSFLPLTLWRVQQPLKRIPFYRLLPRTAELVGHGSCSGVRCFPPHLLACSASSHSLLADHENSHTVTPHHSWSSGLQRGALEGPLIFNSRNPTVLSMRSKPWYTHRRLHSTTTATKSVLKQGVMPGKRTLKGPRTKQPSRTNLPATEEASHML